MTGRFRKYTITKVPRAENSQPDALAKLTSSCVTDTPSGRMVKTTRPSVNLGVVVVNEEDESWSTKSFVSSRQEPSLKIRWLPEESRGQSRGIVLLMADSIDEVYNL
ncbi:hypothetical protein BHE74_00045680 [Ensete ventricosum]|nr:hypothetical protein BHE74_00045680 [Ensete ventricosum]